MGAGASTQGRAWFKQNLAQPLAQRGIKPAALASDGGRRKLKMHERHHSQFRPHISVLQVVDANPALGLAVRQR